MANARIGGINNWTEGHLPERENEPRPKLRLKNGSEVDARIAYVDWQMLEAVETRTPESLEALVAIARRDDKSVGPAMREHLRQQYLLWFDRDGEMEPVLREVILSAIRHTRDGSLLVFPFDIKSEADKDIFTQVQHEDDDFILRRKPPRKDYGPSR